MPEPVGRRLNSWKEIAVYVQRDVRTLARWEKERGMPVRRVPGERGQVFAYSDEIDRWLTRSEAGQGDEAPPAEPRGPESAAASPPRTAPWTGGWRVRAAVAAAMVLLALGLAVTARPALLRRPPVVKLQAERNHLLALTESGEAWRKSFDRRILLTAPEQPYAIADMTGDGDPEIAAVVGRGEPTEYIADTLHMFSSSGRELWQRQLAESVTFGSHRFDPPWNTGPMRIVRTNGGSHVLWLTHHHTWWPAIAVRFDAAGTRTGRFVHAGWLTSAAGLEDGTVVMGGVSNQHGSDVFVVLDAASWDGAGPPGEGLYECRACPEGRPYRYFVLPRSELSVATGSTRQAAHIHVFAHGVEVRVVQKKLGSADIIYEFTRDFTLRAVRPSDAYWAWHRELESSGLVTHAEAACPEHVSVRAKLWERERGWSELTVAGDRAVSVAAQ